MANPPSIKDRGRLNPSMDVKYVATTRVRSHFVLEPPHSHYLRQYPLYDETSREALLSAMRCDVLRTFRLSPILQEQNIGIDLNPQSTTTTELRGGNEEHYVVAFEVQCIGVPAKPNPTALSQAMALMVEHKGFDTIATITLLENPIVKPLAIEQSPSVKKMPSRTNTTIPAPSGKDEGSLNTSPQSDVTRRERGASSSGSGYRGRNKVRDNDETGKNSSTSTKVPEHHSNSQIAILTLERRVMELELTLAEERKAHQALLNVMMANYNMNLSSSTSSKPQLPHLCTSCGRLCNPGVGPAGLLPTKPTFSSTTNISNSGICVSPQQQQQIPPPPPNPPSSLPQPQPLATVLMTGGEIENSTKKETVVGANNTGGAGEVDVEHMGSKQSIPPPPPPATPPELSLSRKASMQRKLCSPAIDSTRPLGVPPPPPPPAPGSVLDDIFGKVNPSSGHATPSDSIGSRTPMGEAATRRTLNLKPPTPPPESPDLAPQPDHPGLVSPPPRRNIAPDNIPTSRVGETAGSGSSGGGMGGAMLSPDVIMVQSSPSPDPRPPS